MGSAQVEAAGEEEADPVEAEAILVSDDVQLSPGQIAIAEESVMQAATDNPTWAAILAAFSLKLAGPAPAPGKRLSMKALHLFFTTDAGGGGRLYSEANAQARVDAALGVLTALHEEYPNLMAEIDPTVLVSQMDFLDLAQAVLAHVAPSTATNQVSFLPFSFPGA
jgi:hypothetical protein